LQPGHGPRSAMSKGLSIQALHDCEGGG
jgi:hypothetical protein